MELKPIILFFYIFSGIQGDFKFYTNQKKEPQLRIKVVWQKF